MGMELSYLYLLASLFDWPAYSLVMSLALYPLALLFKFVVTGSTFSRWLKFTLEIVLVVLVIILVAGEPLSGSRAAGESDVSGIVLRILFCGITWLMGHTVPHRQINYYNVAFRLQAGLLIVLVLSQIADSTPPIFIFFLLAPPALFYARWANAFSRGAVPLSSPNLGRLFFAGATVIVPGTILILLFSPDVARSIVNWLGNISDSFSDWAMAQQRAASTQGGFKFNLSCNIRPEIGGTASPGSIAPGPSEGGIGISPVIIWIIVAIILLVVIAFIVFALKKRKPARPAQPPAPVQFRIRKVSSNTLHRLLSFVSRLPGKLWLWLKSLFQKLKRHPGPSEDALRSIRDIYRSLLRWAAGKRIPRDPTQTPLEHLDLLVQKFPEQQENFKQVTEAYLLARYSRKPISQTDFLRIKEIWQNTVTYFAHSQERGG
jgi:hypothetical protein